MPSLESIAKRHAVYVSACIGVSLLAHNALACACFLLACAAALCWHSAAETTFTLAAACTLTVAEGLLSIGAAHATYPLTRGFPVWLFPWSAVRARWVLDLYMISLHLKGPKDDGFLV